MKISTQLSMGTPLVMMLNKTINVCKFLRNKERDPLVNIAFKELYGLLKISKCPVKMGIYKTDMFTLDADKVPRFVPSANFTCLVQFFVYEENQFSRFIYLKMNGRLINLTKNSFFKNILKF